MVINRYVRSGSTTIGSAAADGIRPGTKYSVVIVQSGQVTTLYSGAAGDSTDFDPEGFYSDAHGLWFAATGLPPATSPTPSPPPPTI